MELNSGRRFHRDMTLPLFPGILIHKGHEPLLLYSWAQRFIKDQRCHGRREAWAWSWCKELVNAPDFEFINHFPNINSNSILKKNFGQPHCYLIKSYMARCSWISHEVVSKWSEAHKSEITAKSLRADAQACLEIIREMGILWEWSCFSSAQTEQIHAESSCKNCPTGRYYNASANSEAEQCKWGTDSPWISVAMAMPFADTSSLLVCRACAQKM